MTPLQDDDPGVELAPAKVNLFLHVTGRRADGYHELESLVAFADFGDRVSVRESKDLTLELTGPFSHALHAECPSGDENLVMRAANDLRRLSGREDLGAAITLEKNLPLASGIGGGSADAAATIRALAKHWCLLLGDEWLNDLALGLGADVPACLRSRTAIMRGIGEQVTEADMPALSAVLVNPGISVPTPEVFRGLSGSAPWTAALETVPDEIDLDWVAAQRNDLEPVAMRHAPVIEEVLFVLGRTSGCRLKRMSGSGATCFGLYESAETASEAAKHLGSTHPEWWVFPTTLGSG